jgi:hypothetical protein
MLLSPKKNTCVRGRGEFAPHLREATYQVAPAAGGLRQKLPPALTIAYPPSFRISRLRAFDHLQVAATSDPPLGVSVVPPGPRSDIEQRLQRRAQALICADHFENALSQRLILQRAAIDNAASGNRKVPIDAVVSVTMSGTRRC